ncbi:hypothetical protein [Undibacterium sp. Di24W]|uniref:hypothetical protein n=1 Tax=Undibacterium sp. Di24W TaxID=3413033 RepID=UPI003BF14CFC
MDKILASKLMNDLLSLNEHLNKIAHQIEAIKVEEEKLQFRRGISNLMGGVYGDLMRPIIREFPELDPDKDEEWFKSLKASL